jgi:hypothetical protein
MEYLLIGGGRTGERCDVTSYPPPPMLRLLCKTNSPFVYSHRSSTIPERVISYKLESLLDANGILCQVYVADGHLNDPIKTIFCELERLARKVQMFEEKFGYLEESS